MKPALAQLAEDFLSTLVFLAVYLVFRDLAFAIGSALAVGAAQFGWMIWRRRPIELMQWLSLALVVVLGGAALMTDDPRFVMAKPSMVHFAIGAVMLRRGWMARYMPAILQDRIPESVFVVSGYAWAALMFILGLSNLYIAAYCSFAVWAWFISVGAIGAKIAALGVQYGVFQVLMRRRAVRLQRAQTQLIERS
jgi:intracellular septation protein A